MENRITVINKYTIIIIVIILNLPYFIVDGFHLIAYRTSHYVSGGDFAQLDYFMNIFELFILLLGFFIGRKTKGIVNLYPILLIVLLKDIYLTLAGNPTSISLNSWELYFAPLIAMGVIRIVGSRTSAISSFEYYMDALILCNFFYQILFMLTGRIGDAGRVTVMNQGVGSVGMMCAYYIIYSLLLRNKTKSLYIKILLALVSIFLSGSRFSLLLVSLAAALNVHIIFTHISAKQRRLFFAILITMSIGIIFVLSNEQLNNNYEIVSRMSSLFQQGAMTDAVSEDASFIERVMSFTAGFDILRQNHFGVANSFVALQTETIKNGFFSFPHSTIFCYYLLWGPVVLYCIKWMIDKCIYAARSHDKGSLSFLLIMMVCFIIYGGIETAPKVYSFIFCILSAINIRLKRTV